MKKGFHFSTAQVVLVILVIGALSYYGSGGKTIFVFVPLTSTPGPTVIPQGSAWCQSAGAVISVSQAGPGNQYPNCFYAPININLGLKDSAWSGSLGTSWYCTLLTPSGQPIENNIQSGANNCNFTGTYYPGQAYVVRIAKSSTSTYGKGSTSGANTVIYQPLPAATPGAGGIGTVPFLSASCSSPPCAINFPTPVTQQGTWTWKIGLNNGNTTSIVPATSGTTTIFNNGGHGTNPCSGNQCILTYTISENATGTNPFQLGYQSFTQADAPKRTLQLWYVFEMTTTGGSGSNMPKFVGGGGVSQICSKSNTDVFFGVQLSDSAMTLSYDASGNPVGQGITSFNLQIDASQLASGNSVIITPLLYTYFSQSYFATAQGCGTLNSEATSETGGVPTAYVRIGA